MARRNHSEEEGNAFLIPTERYVTGKGEVRMRGLLGGSGRKFREAEAHLREHHDAHEVTPAEEAKSRSFSGFGQGKMNAARGERTKLVYKRGIGWTSAN